jgi:pimeloyl-ACP methyl ester carboxylesterase
MGLVAIGSLGLVAGLIYESIASRRVLAASPAPGRLVDLGGWRLHLHCQGEGRPTVLIEAGAGGWSAEWLPVTRRLAATAAVRACAYDRAGLGWSDAAPGPRTVERVIAELRALIERAPVDTPLILVGHSYGGYLARIFRRRHPGMVSGIALIEAAHEAQWDRLPEQVRGFAQDGLASARFAPALARLGVLRLMSQSNDSPTAALDVTPTAVSAAIAELRLGLGPAAEDAGRSGRLDDLPLTVVTADNSFAAFSSAAPEIPLRAANLEWMRLQRELGGLSRNAVHLVLDGTHQIHREAPDAVAAAVAELIRRTGAGGAVAPPP